VDLKTTRPTHLTYDFGVACIFHQANQSSTRNQNIIITNLNYAGLLKGNPSCGLFWASFGFVQMFMNPTNLRGNAKTICQDEHGFWQVNFQRRFSPTMEPYVFPVTVSQVLTSIFEVPLENHTYKTQNIKRSINVIMVCPWF
jgi:hypothetical protein